jgi:hypothetical protein
VIQFTREQALNLTRIAMVTLACDAETAAKQLNLPEHLRAEVIAALKSEQAIRIVDAAAIVDRRRAHVDWLPRVDRQTFVYWPRLREYLLARRGLSESTVNEHDRATDRILGEVENPRSSERFKVRGLVLGYVQSGKTTNYSSLLAKAADVGFRFFIVLSGIHNGLRLQTQRRLEMDIVAAPGMRPLDAQHVWQTLTASRMNGDFDPGTVNTGMLAHPNPTLLVVKKNVSVLNRLIVWLDSLPGELRQALPVLIVDDEADQATPNTGGNRLPPDDPEAEADDLGDDAAPSRINERVRTLVNRFAKVAYVAYTATPFANIFIDHEAVDQSAGQDLYPRDFIVDLPKPHGYCGAERIFGRADDDASPELDIIRLVPDEDADALVPRHRDRAFQPHLTASLRLAFDDFVLAGAAMAQRGRGHEPASMLIHTSYLTGVQERLTTEIADGLVDAVKNEWRYERKRGIEQRLQQRWEDDFKRVTRITEPKYEITFGELRDHVTTFVEQLQVRQVNSRTEDELDYERDEDLKVVVVGGNRLSRGLTLENLLVSYYVRPALQYDTLMQMGRWFGFREGYVDLTRIYTTGQLAQWFRDLATVELELRDEISRYERENLTPLDFGVRVRSHPSLLPTSRLKMRATDVLNLSYEGQLVQTINFRFDDPTWLRRNVERSVAFLGGLGKPTAAAGTQTPFWRSVSASAITEFLGRYQMDPRATRVRGGLLLDYIRAQTASGELTDWVVAVVGREHLDPVLGTIDLGIEGEGPINAIERTRVRGTPTLKAIVSATDEAIGLSAVPSDADHRTGRDFREMRPSTQGLMLIYPISRFSGRRPESPPPPSREAIFGDLAKAEDVIGLGLSFPHSISKATVQYVVGSVGGAAQP